ncbi:MAG: bifunctional DNA-formamidopyrimidine glycosylase/DNA-(apurinic or apyrimidinic site) lyase [candidate division Zixibacteria bacterium]|nr:bifunctional DNA-formamidopyrimidine glycosylase/DNA-(apurinic or apyrimidinic site) lyase [candidate division Zixibacteria bacterium]
MPELPEVEVIARGLGKRVKGLTVSKIHINKPEVIKNDNPDGICNLQGKVIEEISRQGKFIIARFSGGGRILTHLGMTGKLLVMPTDEEIPIHSHLVFEFMENHRRLVYNDTRRFGKVLYSLNGEGIIEQELSELGGDPLKISSKRFLKILKSHKRMIKPLLMDQHVIAGMGNIYADESLFEARIHPRVISSELSEQEGLTLYRSIRKILRSAIKAGGSTINDYCRDDGTMGYFQIKHQVYGKADQPCPRCGNTIYKMTVGGRTSSVCINCQRPPVVKPTARVFRDCWWGQ